MHVATLWKARRRFQRIFVTLSSSIKALDAGRAKVCNGRARNLYRKVSAILWFYYRQPRAGVLASWSIEFYLLSKRNITLLSWLHTEKFDYETVLLVNIGIRTFTTQIIFISHRTYSNVQRCCFINILFTVVPQCKWFSIFFRRRLSE